MCGVCVCVFGGGGVEWGGGAGGDTSIPYPWK